MGFWPPLRGEGKNQLERFSFSGITGSNTESGRVFGALTASAVNIYKDDDRSYLVATGSHSQPTTWTKITLSASGGSGLTGSCYLKYDSASSAWEVFATLSVDEDLAVERIDVTRYPKTSAASTFEAQHLAIREQFVRLMLSRIPPALAGRGSANGSATGTLRGSYSSPWRVNSRGDFELVRLQNVESYRQWAVHAVLEMVFRTVNRMEPNDTQLLRIEDERELASAAWAETLPLFDDDDDLDADRQAKRFRISRG